MSMLPNTDAAAQLRIRAEQVLGRKGDASRRAGELAGHFAAMLEALNGVDGGASSSAPAPADAAGVVPAILPRLGIGAVTIFAQSEHRAAGGESPEAPPPDGDAAKAAVDSALGSGNPADFRWLTTLIAQSGALAG